MKPLTTLCVSDLHLYHRRVKTTSILSQLEIWLDENEQALKSSDLFVISGDVWERQIPELDNDFFLVQMFFKTLMLKCREYNVIFVVLNGTRLHDWGQSHHLIPLAKGVEGLDFRYYPKITVEHLDAIDRTILFIPDDMADDPKEVEGMVLDELKKACVKQVDITIMHTQFPHQLPDIEGIKFADPKFYEGITKEFIISGHIHTPSVKGKIITPGSFTRLNHGEEEKKGGVLIKSTRNKFTIKRLWNGYATPFITIKSGEPETIFSRIEKLLKGSRETHYFRILNTTKNPLDGVLEHLNDLYPDHHFKIVTKADKKEQELVKIERLGALSRLTPENLYDTVKKYWEDLGEENFKGSLRLLKEILNARYPNGDIPHEHRHFASHGDTSETHV